jgi:phosphoglycolate phosphatase-like HAD superfamily hydrolase
LKLILFDLDQTLVDVLSHHEAAYEQMFEEVFGVAAKLTDIEFWGKITPNIIEEMARLKRVPKSEVRRRLPEAMEKLEAYFQKSLRKGKVKVLPGVRRLLADLKRRGHALGVLTGNPEGITRAVLKRCGLEGYFDFLIYGSKARRRSELVGEAIAQAGRRFDKRFEGKDVVIIGDSTHDIECGKPYGALTIAVATGFHSKRKLKQHKPGHLFKNLADPGILEILS